MSQHTLFPLTPEQAIAARDELVEALGRKQRIEAEKKMAADGFNKELKELDGYIENMRQILAEHRASATDPHKDGMRASEELQKLSQEFDLHINIPDTE